MSHRLPTPGGDDGDWGTILNDFLSVELNTDGSLKRASDINAKYVKPSTGIPATDLESAVQAELSTVAGKYALPVGGIPTADLDSTVQSELTAVATKYVKPGGGIPATDLESAVQTELTAIAGKYVKPGGGIPLTDLASSVQNSINGYPLAVLQLKVDYDANGNVTYLGQAAQGVATSPSLRQRLVAGMVV